MAESGVSIVTGAGSGVGRETARLLAKAGYRVAMVGRTRSKLDATAGAIREELGPDAGLLVFDADLAEDDAAAGVVERTVAAFGRIDALANVAGFAPLQPIDRITPELWRQNIEINLGAPVRLTAAAWPHFREQRSGVIVNVSSMSSIDPFPGFQIYAAAKVGLNMFTKCTADEGKAIGVRAVCIAPGAIETPMLRQHWDESVLPRNKTLSPTDVAQTIRDLITGDRTFTTGATIVLPSE